MLYLFLLRRDGKKDGTRRLKGEKKDKTKLMTIIIIIVTGD